MKIIKSILALLLAFAAINTNISILSKSQVIGEILGVVTVDVLFGGLNYFCLNQSK